MVSYEIHGNKIIKIDGDTRYPVNPESEGLVLLSLRYLVSTLLTEETIHLFNELNSYIQKYPIIAKYTEDGVLTKDEVSKLLILFENHKGSEQLSEGLYNVLKGALTVQLEEDNA